MTGTGREGAAAGSAFEEWLSLVGRTGEAPPQSPIYRMKLTGSIPGGLTALPIDRRPPDLARGLAIMAGRWRFGAHLVQTPPDRAPWGPPFPSPHFADRIHRFHWMRDIASQGLEGEAKARALTVSWVDAFGKWEPFAWRPSPTADRIVNLLSAGPWLIEGLEGGAREDVLDSMARQVRHLAAFGDDETDPQARFRIAVAMVLAGASMEGMERHIEPGLAMLEREIANQILADGGHVSRSPEALANALLDVHVVEDLLLRTGRTAPAVLTRIQTRMAPMLSFLTLPGGRLLPVNGGGEGVPGLSKAALQPHGDLQARFAFARISGFHRVTAGDIALYMDTGPAPDSPQGGRAHAGALGVWINDGPDPLIVSCGAHADLEPALRDAARRTAAHSTLSLNREDSAVFRRDEETGCMSPVGPSAVAAHRLEENDQFLLEGQHSGWRVRFGLVYRRRLYVSREGDRVTGEDAVSRPVSEALPPPDEPVGFTIRFHLHPEVRIARGDDGRTVYLGLESSRRVWRFRSEADVHVEESRYWGAGSSRKANQLVITGRAEPSGDGSSPPNRVRWALVRQDEEAGRD